MPKSAEILKECKDELLKINVDFKVEDSPEFQEFVKSVAPNGWDADDPAEQKVLYAVYNMISADPDDDYIKNTMTGSDAKTLDLKLSIIRDDVVIMAEAYLDIKEGTQLANGMEFLKEYSDILSKYADKEAEALKEEAKEKELAEKAKKEEEEKERQKEEQERKRLEEERKAKEARDAIVIPIKKKTRYRNRFRESEVVRNRKLLLSVPSQEFIDASDKLNQIKGTIDVIDPDKKYGDYSYNDVLERAEATIGTDVDDPEDRSFINAIFNLSKYNENNIPDFIMHGSITFFQNVEEFIASLEGKQLDDQEAKSLDFLKTWSIVNKYYYDSTEKIYGKNNASDSRIDQEAALRELDEKNDEYQRNLNILSGNIDIIDKNKKLLGDPMSEEYLEQIAYARDWNIDNPEEMNTLRAIFNLLPEGKEGDDFAEELKYVTIRTLKHKNNLIRKAISFTKDKQLSPDEKKSLDYLNAVLYVTASNEKYLDEQSEREAEIDSLRKLRLNYNVDERPDKITNEQIDARIAEIEEQIDKADSEVDKITEKYVEAKKEKENQERIERQKAKSEEEYRDLYNSVYDELTSLRDSYPSRFLDRAVDTIERINKGNCPKHQENALKNFLNSLNEDGWNRLLKDVAKYHIEKYNDFYNNDTKERFIRDDGNELAILPNGNELLAIAFKKQMDEYYIKPVMEIRKYIPEGIVRPPHEEYLALAIDKLSAENKMHFEKMQSLDTGKLDEMGIRYTGDYKKLFDVPPALVEQSKQKSKELEGFAVKLKNIDTFKDIMLKELIALRGELAVTQKEADANFVTYMNGEVDESIKEGPEDYQKMAKALKEAIEALQNKDATINEVNNAMKSLKSKADIYSEANKSKKGKTDEELARLNTANDINDLADSFATKWVELFDELNGLAADGNYGVEMDANLNDKVSEFQIKFQNALDAKANGAIIDKDKVKTQSEKAADKYIIATEKDILYAQLAELNKVSSDKVTKITGSGEKDPVKAARKYLTKVFIDKAKAKDVTLDTIHFLRFEANKDAFDQNVKKLSENALFKDIAKKTPNDTFNKWNKIMKESDKIKSDFFDLECTYNNENSTFGQRLTASLLCDDSNDALRNALVIMPDKEAAIQRFGDFVEKYTEAQIKKNVDINEQQKSMMKDKMLGSRIMTEFANAEKNAAKNKGKNKTVEKNNKKETNKKK